jgi:orotate phosphoribosyltransferase
VLKKNRGDIMSEITKALEDCGALQFGEFTLASGAKSNYYIDIKKASTNPQVLYLISQLMAEKMQINNLRPDRIAGVVLGSIPLAAALSLATGIPFIMVRKEKKDHGTGKLIEGDLNTGEKVLVVEDVITTAGSSIKAIETLRSEGAEIVGVMSVIDREGGGLENLASIGVELNALVKGSELIKGRL